MAKQFELEELEALFHCHKDMVFKTAYLILGDTQEAEDVLQEVFIKVYRAGDTFHPEKGGLNTWLHRITVNQCISKCRKKHLPSFSLDERLEEGGFDPPGAPSQLPEELLIKQEEGERMQRAMKSLDKKHRAVLTLRYFDDLSYDEITQVLKIPLGTVKSRLNTAIKALRKELTP